MGITVQTVSPTGSEMSTGSLKQFSVRAALPSTGQHRALHTQLRKVANCWAPCEHAHWPRLVGQRSVNTNGTLRLRRGMTNKATCLVGLGRQELAGEAAQSTHINHIMANHLAATTTTKTITTNQLTN
jgi:hypothetical protein